MRFRSLAIGIIAATFFSPPTFAAPGDDEIAAIYFVRLQQFASKCASQEAIDRAWCEAYIAGVVDTIGSNRRLQEDQAQARCLRKKIVSLSQVREAVMKVVNMMLEEKNPVVMKTAAMNSVVAGVIVHVCD